MKKIILMIMTAMFLFSGCAEDKTVVPSKAYIPDGAVKDYECGTTVTEKADDFDSNGIADSIGVYTSAEKDKDGKFAWDDMNKWCVMASLNGKSYELYLSNISAGRVDYNVYQNLVGETVITVTEQSTARYVVVQYKLSPVGLMRVNVINDSGINMVGGSFTDAE